MRLLNITTLKLEDKHQLERKLKEKHEEEQRKEKARRLALKPHEDSDQPAKHFVNTVRKARIPFICISHVWYDRGRPIEHEVLPEDLEDHSWRKRKRKGADKVLGACEAVRKWSEQRSKALRKAGSKGDDQPVEFIWIDTCCVDQKNPAEVSASINSMFRWYSEAIACFVYLHDLEPSSSRDAKLTKCEWFSRGWTLQELIAAPEAEFYDAGWNPIGNKSAGSTMEVDISRITNIDTAILRNAEQLRDCKLSLRMAWAAGRTTRFEEDRAYSLLGIFNVQMPTLYGEGEESAFRRLQEEIIKYSDDHSIFAWCNPEAAADDTTGLLAPSARCFQTSSTYRRAPRRSTVPYAMTNKGLSIELCLLQLDAVNYVASLDCEKDADHVIGLYLRCISTETQEYRRVRPNELTSVKKMARGELRRIFVRQVYI
jgi:Heterokaryon incompatibility protein (HET)